MTLQELIDRHEAAARLNRPTAVVTPYGHACRHALAMLDALADLDARRRADILALLRDRLPELPPVA